jgi:ribonuclease I
MGGAIFLFYILVLQWVLSICVSKEKKNITFQTQRGEKNNNLQLYRV